MRARAPADSIADMTELSPYWTEPTALAVVHGIRASDSEREHVARILRAAAGEGMLTLGEADERLASLYATRARSELAPLTADLPDGGRELIENTPEARHAARAGFRRHLLTVTVVSALLITGWVLSGADFFWPAWPLVFMAFSLARHAQRIGVTWRR